MRMPVAMTVAVVVLMTSACGLDATFPEGTLTTVPAELIDAPPRNPRRIAALLFDIGRGPPDRARVVRAFDTAANSVRSLYRAVSYGIQDLAIDVLGPYTLPVPRCLTRACCGPTSDETGNGPAVAQIIAGLPTTYDHYFWIYGDNSADPTCSTWGDLGTPAAPARYASFARIDVTAVAQEIGHNFGLEHEHSLECGGIESWADDPSACATIEYGSNLSFMGIGTGHPSGFNKAHERWLSGCNIVKTGGGGRFTLLPLGLPCGGPQLLQIPAPKVRHPPRQSVGYYYAELRTSQGQDTARTPTVLIYAGPDFGSPDHYAEHTFLLAPRLMFAGQTFEDPAGGLTISLEAISATSAVVNVSGPPSGTAATCADGTPFESPGGDAANGGEGAGAGAGNCAAGVGGAPGAAVVGAGGGPTTGTGAAPGGLIDAEASGGDGDPAGATPVTDAASAGGCSCGFHPPPFGDAGEARAPGVFSVVAAAAWWVRRRRRTRTDRGR